MPNTGSDTNSTASTSTIIRKSFAQEQRRAGDGRGDQRVQAVVGQLAREAAIQDQRAGEGEDDPEQAARHFARGLLLRDRRRS